METTMELDELKQAWQSLDRQLEKKNALNLQLFKESKVSKMKSGLRLLVTGHAIQIAAGVVLSVLSAPFWIEHFGVWHLMLYGLSLHVYGIMFIAFGARSLYHVGQVDYAAPVLTIQKQLAELRAWRLRSGFWFALAGCFAWTPLLLMGFYWLGADIWVYKPAFVYWYLASSFVAVAATWGFIRFSQRPGQEKLRKAINDNAVGHSLARVQATLDEVARFERD